MKKYIVAVLASLIMFSGYSQDNYKKYNVQVKFSELGKIKYETGYLERISFPDGYKLTFMVKVRKKGNASNRIHLHLYYENYMNYVAIYVDGKKKKGKKLDEDWWSVNVQGKKVYFKIGYDIQSTVWKKF